MNDDFIRALIDFITRIQRKVVIQKISPIQKSKMTTKMIQKKPMTKKPQKKLVLKTR